MPGIRPCLSSTSPPAWRPFFTDVRDPEPRSRRVFAFHRPETLAGWASDATVGAGLVPVLRAGTSPAPTLRARLRALPPLITTGLWDAQIEAVRNLEQSLAADRPRALIQMATGSGKTYAAVTFVYRLIKHARACRVLFMVDRTNLGIQALREFRQYVTPDDGRKFGELYNVQLMTSNALDLVSKVWHRWSSSGRLRRIWGGSSGSGRVREE
ncbi:MAG: DEAD/DEAH box helicase family protein [Anaerolineae bacterium]